jgi:quinol monooxygenase YgiN
MLIRIVRMEFHEDKIDEFLQIFESISTTISSFDGCLQVDLKRDTTLMHVFYTHSKWESENALNNYRNSEFFKETWTKTRRLFSNKAQAFSLVDV